jgi:uncharacterized protein YqjF (DUF2071 family)
MSTAHPHEKAFLTGQWRTLLMANYRVDPDLLRSLVPRGTELDSFNGHYYMSLVGFMFRDIRVLGMPAYFHRTFEEVNLRFYVRYESDHGLRRGVVFIKEIVPRPLVTTLANLLYNEHYVTHPMRHRITHGDPIHVSYGWKLRDDWYDMSATADAQPQPLEQGSEAEFITEHFWGYTARSKTCTLEYEVEHPRWNLFPVTAFHLTGDMQALYGNPLGACVTSSPHSVFLADGSQITVRKARAITSSPTSNPQPLASRL